MHSLIRLLPQILKLSGYLSGILWLFQVRILVKKIKPDILHAHYIGVPAYLGITSGFHPIVLSAWGSDILIDANQSLLRGILSKYALKRADRIISVSLVLKEEIIKRGAASKKIEVIPMGIETQKFRPSLRSDTLLRELGIVGSPVVISTRSLKPVYDVETFIRATPLVLQQIPEAKFIVVGEGEQRLYLENLAQGLGVTGSIIFTGRISDSEFPRHLASSDVYVSTSLSDGTSVSLLEALACELAPVVTDIPANRPWVTDGDNGFLISVGDYEMLAERIVLLLKDKETRSRFGKLGRNAVIERAEYVNQMSRVEGIYEELKRA
jgi:glycosyltransferase involved in cell wall biosynthesis